MWRVQLNTSKTAWSMQDLMKADRMSAKEPISNESRLFVGLVQMLLQLWRMTMVTSAIRVAPGMLGKWRRSHFLGDHSKEVKEYFAQAKSRQETTNTRYKNFCILGTSFRHKGKRSSGSKEKIKLHGLVLDSISVVLQYDLENGNPLFDMQTETINVSIITLHNLKP